MLHIALSSLIFFLALLLRLSFLLTAKLPLYPFASLLRASSLLIVLGDLPNDRTILACENPSLFNASICQLQMCHVSSPNLAVTRPRASVHRDAASLQLTLLSSSFGEKIQLLYGTARVLAMPQSGCCVYYMNPRIIT